MLNRWGIGVRIDGTDIGNVVIEGGSIEYGRQDVLEQPQNATCDLTVFTRDGWPQNPRAWFDYGAPGVVTAASHFAADHDTQDTYAGPLARISIGSVIWVSLTTDTHFADDHDTQDTYTGQEFRRFTGRINSLDYGYHALHIGAVADMEAWARVGILANQITAPQPDPATDVDQVEWLCAETPSPTTLHVEGADGPEMVPWTDDDFPLCLLDEITRIASDADALLYANREGNVTYQTRRWSPGSPTVLPGGIIDAEEIGMVMELGSNENTVTVEYGTPPSPGDPLPDVTVDDADAVTMFGVRRGYYTTRLAGVDEATDHARTIRAAQVVAWAMPDFNVRMNLATYATVQDVAALDLGHRVTVEGLSPGAPLTDVTAEIVGYSEALSSFDWQIDFHLGPPYTRHYDPPG